MLLDLINDVVGAPPVGWEFVPYLVAAVLFVALFLILGYFFTGLFHRFWR